jgi:hypothetical protein
MENNTNWEIVGDNQAPIIFQVEGTTIDARESSIEVRGWHTKDLINFGNYMLDRYPAKTQDAIDENRDFITPVTDADFENWKLLREESSVEVSPSSDSNDIQLQYAGTFGGSQEEIAE